MKAVARVCRAVTAIALAIMALVTVADILVTNLLNMPIRGTFEIISVTLVTLVFAGLFEVFLNEENVEVTILDALVSTRALALLKLFGALVTAGFMSILVYAMIAPLKDNFTYVEYMQETGLPLWVSWAVVFAGTVAATFAAIVATIRRLRFPRIGATGR